MLPPCRTVAFTSQQRGSCRWSLELPVLLGSGEYEDSESRGASRYERWIEQVHQVQPADCRNVGELKFKNFILDEAFDLSLIRRGAQALRIRVQRRFDLPLWVGVAAILVAVVYGGREFLLLSHPGELVRRRLWQEVPAAPDSHRLPGDRCLAQTPAVETAERPARRIGLPDAVSGTMPG